MERTSMLLCASCEKRNAALDEHVMLAVADVLEQLPTTQVNTKY